MAVARILSSSLVIFLLVLPVRCSKKPRRPVHRIIFGAEGQQPEEEAQDEADGGSDRDHHGVVLKLNDNIFHGNVLRETDNRVDHWLVLWCPTWFEPCQSIMQVFEGLSVEWQTALNEGRMLKLTVRFARVDCAVDKPLCNEMEVEEYPTVQHYRGAKRVAAWTSRQKKDLRAWVEERIGDSKRGESTLWSGEFLISHERMKDAFVVILLLVINLWAVVQNPQLWQKARTTASSSQAEQPPVEQPKPDETPAEQQPQQRIERLLPDEWLRQRNSTSAGIEL